MVAPLIAAAAPTIARMVVGSAARGAAGGAASGGTAGGMGAAAQAFGKQALVSGAVRAATHRHGGGAPAPAGKDGGFLGRKGEALLAYAAMPSGPNLHDSANQAYGSIIQPMQFGNH